MSTGSESGTSVRGVVLLSVLAGAAASLAVVILGPGSWSSTENPRLLAFIAMTTAGQLAYVKVRHGATTEELNFFEVVLAAGILLLEPVQILVATLVGVMIGELIIRRPWIKIAFNMGNYALSASAMIVTYFVLDGGAPMLSTRSVISLLVASGVFTAMNLLVVAELLHTTTAANRWEVMAEEWRLSALMAVGSVGVGAVAVALALYAQPLLPFAFLPALALWYAYGAAAQHAEARERNRWLVTLGGALAEHGREANTLADSAEAIRQIVGAPELAVIEPHAAASPSGAGGTSPMTPLALDASPRPMAEGELPEGWRTGVVTLMDVGAGEPGAIALGSTYPYRRSRISGRTRGWALQEGDAPVLGALVAAVGSAMRAGAAFNALSEETAKLTAVVDNTSDGIAMIDDSGRVRLWSQTMARMTGVDGDALGDGAGADSASPIVPALVGVTRRADDVTPVQMHLVRDDGEELDVSVMTVRVRESMPAPEADSPGWVSILTLHDETRERRVERMKTDFVATISHELRTPITPIKGYAHLLATRGDRVSPEKRIQALRVISDRADHLTRLVDDLLLASQVSDSTRLGIDMGIEDLGEILRQAVASFPSMTSRITLNLPEAPVAVQCDRVRTMQCLSNLLGNAEKYTPEGSPIEIRVEVSDLRAHIIVRDQGLGIPVSEQAKVFERFYRREDPFTMRTGGAGLGLHIARELALAMGGGLTLRSPETGTGSEFVMHLLTSLGPAPTGSQGPAARDRAPGQSGDEMSQHGLRPSRQQAQDATMGQSPGPRLAAS